MKTKWLIFNIVGLLAAIAVFSSTFIYAATNINQVKVVSSSEVSSANDDFYQNEVGIADLIFTSSSNNENEVNIETSSAISEESSSKTVESSSLPSSSSVSSKPKPISSKPTSSVNSSKPLPPSSKPSSKPSSEISSEESPSSSQEQIPEDIDNDLLMILSGTVQREIIGTNTPPKPAYYEAYKAQAIACHSYMQYHKNRTGTYPTMSYSTPYEKTIQLVSTVLNEMMYYNGSVINASYHAASGGQTQNAIYVWGYDVPYLRGVDSKYDDYNGTCIISASNLRDKLSAVSISVDGDPSTWFDLSRARLTDGGFIDTIPVGNTEISGRRLRENVIGSTSLKSCKIVDISVSGDNFIFSTKGYGHGVGMSQLGALGYAANEGYTYNQILSHYYPGITIK